MQENYQVIVTIYRDEEDRQAEVEVCTEMDTESAIKTLEIAIEILRNEKYPLLNNGIVQ